LHTAQCNDSKKVLYGPHLLRGAAQSWWESYLATHADPEAITWEEFRDNFHRYHVPEGLMIVRKEKFLALKQRPPSVSEYRDKFLLLSRYAPEDVNTDAKRQYYFLRGVVDPHHYQLMNHTFPTFQHLIDRAVMTERKCHEMEDRNAKSMDLRPGVAVIPATQATHLSKQGHQHQHQHQRQHQQQYQRQFPQQQQQQYCQNNQAVPVQVGSRACFYCGEQNHWAKHCPQKATQQSPAVNPSARQGAPHQAPGGRGQAYTRGKVNHLEAEAI
jgi:hypothetical protein